MFACITLAIVLGVLATPPAYVDRGSLRRTYFSPIDIYYNTPRKPEGFRPKGAPIGRRAFRRDVCGAN